MSKATDDLIERIQGAATALRGVKTKLSPQAQPAQVEVTTPAAPAPQVEQEDYAHAKQVINEMKGNIEALLAEVEKDSKVPGADATKSGGVLGDPKSAAHQSQTHDQSKKA